MRRQNQLASEALDLEQGLWSLFKARHEFVNLYKRDNPADTHP
jgi:hypothetical protein